MAEDKQLSVQEILAACRQRDGSASSPDAGGPPSAGQPAASANSVAESLGTDASAEPAAAAESVSDAASPHAAKAPGEKSPAAKAPAGQAEPPGKMSVAEILAAARAEKADAAESPASATSPDATSTAESAAASPASSASPPRQSASGTGAARSGSDAQKMSVQEMLAAARAEKAGGKAAQAEPQAKRSSSPAKPKPAAAKPKPAPAAGKTSPKGPAKTAGIGRKDTSSILAAARKADKPGPISKSEAARLREAPPARPPAPRKTVPPIPAKPAYAQPRPARAAAPSSQEDRRSFFGVLLGSFLAVGFSSLTLTNVLWGLGLARYFFPNILIEPPNRFKVGFPGDFAAGTVDTRFKAQFGIWLVNTEYEGEPQIVALKTVCTHLGCTPNWLESEQKFKCPCHGSGFYKDGINFEGPAPRPLERYAIRLADDGQLEVDKSQTFQEELGQWSDADSYVPA